MLIPTISENTFTDNNDGSYEIELRNYSFKEVNRVLKILLPKENEANTDLDGWSKRHLSLLWRVQFGGNKRKQHNNIRLWL